MKVTLQEDNVLLFSELPQLLGTLAIPRELRVRLTLLGVQSERKDLAFECIVKPAIIAGVAQLED